MNKAIITQIHPTTVRRILPAGHELNYSWPEAKIIEDYVIPNAGGYVRLGENQVCATISSRGDTFRGHTLMATPDDLLSVIRKEHASQMRSNKL